MGKLVVSTAMTVDGVMSVAEWFVPNGGHDAAGKAMLAASEAAVVGRKNFEGLAGYWTKRDGRVGRPREPDAEVRRLANADRAVAVERDAARGRRGDCRRSAQGDPERDGARATDRSGERSYAAPGGGLGDVRLGRHAPPLRASALIITGRGSRDRCPSAAGGPSSAAARRRSRSSSLPWSSLVDRRRRSGRSRRGRP
jgi:hypothetical protein